jgi:protein-S-isoprenylcysteine O-methyltransferase Ste14
MLQIMVFFVGGLGLAAFSWRTFSDTRSYQFFRFISFETLWALIVLSAPSLVRIELSPGSIIAGMLSLIAFVLGAVSILLLVSARKSSKPPRRQAGASRTQAPSPVTGGPYRYIRHPIYTSLLLFAWGLTSKHFSFFSILLALAVTGLLLLTARAEELENLERFGEKYDRYMERTKMFLPGLY